jgi:hypothetical protein
MRHVRERATEAVAKTTRRTTAAREEDTIVVAEVVMFLDLSGGFRGERGEN